MVVNIFGVYCGNTPAAEWDNAYREIMTNFERLGNIVTIVIMITR